MNQPQDQPVTIAVRVPACVAKDLRRVAQENGRTVPSEVRRLIAKHLAPDVAAVGK